MDMLFIPGWLIFAIVAAIVLIILLAKGYVNAKPNEVVVITGLRKQRHLRGKAGFMIPFVEQRSYLDIEQFSTDVRTSESVPTLDFINVRADAAVKLKIGTTDEMIDRAAENFLNWNTTDISNSVQDVLEGNLREVIGQMELRKMVNDRQEFASKVQDNVAPDLAKMGLEVIAFTVQSFSDEGGVIDNLGIENVETIKKDALIAKAKAERERKEVEAEQDKLANDKRVAADLEIAQKQNELKLKQAALKQEADIAQAKADAAKGIEAEIQRREQERVAAEANIMKQEKELGLKFDVVVDTVGSTGTFAGLALGKLIHKADFDILGFSINESSENFKQASFNNIKDCCKYLSGSKHNHTPESIGISVEDLNIIDTYVGGGYAINSKEDFEFIRDFARTEGIFVDPVYTGKALRGLFEEIRKSKLDKYKNILFIHTGGLYGLFPKGEEFSPYLG